MWSCQLKSGTHDVCALRSVGVTHGLRVQFSVIDDVQEHRPKFSRRFFAENSLESSFSLTPYATGALQQGSTLSCKFYMALAPVIGREFQDEQRIPLQRPEIVPER
jgi:hypothetical protein